MYCKVTRTANIPELYTGQILEIAEFAKVVARALNAGLEMPVAEYYPCA